MICELIGGPFDGGIIEFADGYDGEIQVTSMLNDVQVPAALYDTTGQTKSYEWGTVHLAKYIQTLPPLGHLKWMGES